MGNSAAGANFGYSLLWTLAVIAMARFVILESTARYVMATGETVLAGYRRAAKWSPWVIFGAIVMRRHLSNLYHILLMGLAPCFLLGQDTLLMRNVFALASCGAAFLVMYSGGYKTVERFSKPLAFLLGMTVLVTAIYAKPDPAAIWAGIVSPSLPSSSGSGGIGLGLVLLMLVGTGVGSLSNLKYSAFIYEKGWRDPSHLKKQRIDMLGSLLGALLIAALLQIAAGAVLKPEGLTLKKAEDLIPLFTAALGESGRILMALGLWTTVFTTYVGSNTGYSLLVCDILAAAREGGHTAEQRRKAYRGFLLFFCISPMYVLWTGWKPVPIVIACSALMALAVPLVTVLLFKITADRERLGRLANGKLATAAMAVVIIASIGVAYGGVMELLGLK